MSAISDRGSRSLLIRLLLVTVVVILAAQAALSYLAFRAFERDLVPELHKKAEIVGRSVDSQIEHAVGLGIPIEELVGMTDFLDSLINNNTDIAYLAVLNDDGQTLHSSGLPLQIEEQLSPPDQTDLEGGQRRELGTVFDTGFPIIVGNRLVGSLHVGVDKTHLSNELLEILYDVLVVLLISLLIALEFLLFFVVVRVSTPLQAIRDVLDKARSGDLTRQLRLRSGDEIGRFCASFDDFIRRLGERYTEFRADVEEAKAGQIDKGTVRRIEEIFKGLSDRFRFADANRIERATASTGMRMRAPLFIFMFSEELSRSFLPLYIRELYVPVFGLPQDIVISLPITIFMATVALVTPLSGRLADQFGPRRIFLMGLVPAVIGYIGAAAATSLYDFILWRALSAIGYGLIFISSQSYIAENTSRTHRAQGMAIFVGAVAAASICGPAIGGILADRLGYRVTFFVAAAMAVIAGYIVYRSLEKEEKPRADRDVSPGFSAAHFGILLRDRRFFSLVFFAAIPGKLMLAGILFYLMPLFLFELGESQSAIGRNMMLYGIMTIILSPAIAYFVDVRQRHSVSIAIGGLIAGAGCLAVLMFDNGWGALTAIVALGIGHAFSLSSQLAVAQSIAEDYSDRLGKASVLATYRLLERIGTVLGPLIVAALATLYGFANALSLIGIGAIALSLIFALVYHRALPGSERIEGYNP